MRWLVLFFITVFIAACGPSVPVEPLSNKSLDAWLQQDIAPYLTQRFSHHPRFQGTTFAITHMSFGQIDPNTDGLSARVIKTLKTYLAKQPIQMVELQPQATNSCQILTRAHYLIGVEAKISARGHLEVHIDAYDDEQGHWTVGFEKIWRMPLRDEETQELAKQSVDTGLLGQKFLPYQVDQAQQFVSDFEQALRCVKQQQGVSIQVERSGKYLPTPLQTWMARIQTQGDATGKSIQLIATGENRAANLYSLTLADNGQPLLKRFIRLKRPTLPTPRLQPLTTNPLTTKLKAVAGSAEDTSIPMLDVSALVAPQGSGLCATPNPWALGEKTLTNSSELSSDNCFAIKVVTQRPAYLTLIGRNSRGQLSRFHPTVCAHLDDAPNRLAAERAFYYPTRKGVKALGLDDNVGHERIYVMLAANREVKAILRSSLGDIPEICEDNKTGSVEVERWEAKLKQFEQHHPGLFEWQVHSFEHVMAP